MGPPVLHGSRLARVFVLGVELFVVHIHEIFLMLITWIVARTGKKEVEAACLGESSAKERLLELITPYCYFLTSPGVL